jgi:ABC-type transport system involved in multi-copper enzyme maturation permease subunit
VNRPVTPPVRTATNFQQRFDELITSNPMMIEVTRFKRKFLNISSNNTVNVSVMVLFAVVYLAILALVFSANGYLQPGILVNLQLTVVCFLVPSMFHGAIAGERERRSWDLLLVAPISKAQIVVGKFFAAVATLFVAIGACALPIAIAAATYAGRNPETARFNPVGVVLAQQVLVFAFGIALAAFTILFSARVRRGLTALGVVFGLETLFLVVLPIFVGLMGGGGSDQVLTDFAFFLHPFYTLAKMEPSWQSSYEAPTFSPWMWGAPQILIYVGLAAVFLQWAITTLYYAENDVKFIPDKKKADA